MVSISNRPRAAAEASKKKACTYKQILISSKLLLLQYSCAKSLPHALFHTLCTHNHTKPTVGSSHHAVKAYREAMGCLSIVFMPLPVSQARPYDDNHLPSIICNHVSFLPILNHTSLRFQCYMHA